MSRIGARCHELRIVDATKAWRIVYRVDRDAVIIGAVFAKTTPQTPDAVIRTVQQRLRAYDAASAAEE